MKNVKRQSNMELLRVVSMLFVLILHANYTGIHAPTSLDLSDAPFKTFIRSFIESISIVAVDVFVLISGWFGIKFTYVKLGSLFFQILFFTMGFFLVFAIIDPSEAFTIDKIKGVFMLNGDYWFVKSYLVLFLLSPILNVFIENVSQKQFLTILVSYYTFHTIYGWLMDASVRFSMNGTTGLSFIGLYLIGRYFRLYPCKLTTMNRNMDLLLFGGCALLLSLCNLVLLYKGQMVSVEGRLFSYASPVVIFASVALLLFFSKLSFSSRVVNWIASSCFAVYLFHSNGFFFDKYYKQLIATIYNDSCYAVWGVMAYIVLIYAVAVLIDKIRIALWNFVERCFSRENI